MEIPEELREQVRRAICVAEFPNIPAIALEDMKGRYDRMADAAISAVLAWQSAQQEPAMLAAAPEQEMLTRQPPDQDTSDQCDAD
jgi:hypothetical protein